MHDNRYRLPVNQYGNYDASHGMPDDWALYKTWFNRFTDNDYPCHEFLLGFNERGSQYYPIIQRGFHLDHLADIATATRNLNDWKLAGRTPAMRVKNMLRIHPDHYRKWLRQHGDQTCLDDLAACDIKCQYEWLAMLRWVALLKNRASLDTLQVLKDVVQRHGPSQAESLASVDFLNVLHRLDRKAAVQFVSDYTNFSEHFHVHFTDWDKVKVLQDLPLKTSIELLEHWLSRHGAQPKTLTLIQYFGPMENPVITRYLRHRLRHKDKLPIRRQADLSDPRPFFSFGTRADLAFVRRAMLKTEPENFGFWTRWRSQDIARVFDTKIPDCLPVSLLVQQGYDLQMLMECESPKELCKLLIETAHPQELALLESAPMAFLPMMSNLRELYFNRQKKKVRRQQLLARLTWMNAGENRKSLVLAQLTSDQCIRMMAFTGEERFFQLSTYPDARDSVLNTLRLLAHDKTLALAEKRWNRLLDIHGEINAASAKEWHDYVHNAAYRHIDASTAKLEVPLHQSRWPESIDIPGCGYWVEMPQTDKCIRRVGRRFRHCIGSQHYVRSAMSGHFIFVVRPQQQEDRNRSKGVTVYTDPELNVISARGFANRCTDDEEDRAIEAVIRYLREVVLREINLDPAR